MSSSWNMPSSSQSLTNNLFGPPSQPPSRGFPFASALGSSSLMGPSAADLQLDMSEFPALGSAANHSNSIGASGAPLSYASTIGTHGGGAVGLPPNSQEFSSDDFPALGSASGSASQQIQNHQDHLLSTMAGALQQAQNSDDRAAEHNSKTALNNVGAALTSTSSAFDAIPNGDAKSTSPDNDTPETPPTPLAPLKPADRYGLLGLLGVIRMTDPDLSMLALGSDLTTLGLNLNSPDALYSTFASPWVESNQTAGLNIEPEFHLPSCYNVQPPPPAQSKISTFSDETLFYIFYSMPKDFLQEASAQELYNRNWRYHKELHLWLTKEQGTEPTAKTQAFERGTYIFFDPNSWEKVKKDAILMYESLEDKPIGSVAAAAVAGGPMGHQQLGGAQAALGGGVVSGQSNNASTGAPMPPQQQQQQQQLAQQQQQMMSGYGGMGGIGGVATTSTPSRGMGPDGAGSLGPNHFA